jgi:integrase
MPLFRKNGMWWVSYFRHGRRVSRSTNETTRGRAQAYVRQLNLQATDPGEIQTLFEMTLGTAAARYVELLLMSKGRKPGRRVRRSVRNEILRVRRVEDFFGRDRPVIDLMEQHAIGEFNYTLLHEMKPSSANRYLILVKAILNRAYEWGAIPRKPEIRLNKETVPPFRALSSHEETRLLEFCADSIRDFVIFLLDTGARRSEALELTWDNVDLDRRPRPVVHLTETKGGRVRSVPLPLRSTRMLQRRRRQIPISQRFVFIERARKNIWETNASGQLYAQKGNWIPLSALTKRWTEARAAAGLLDCRMHDLRHTYASKLVRNGVPLLQVCRLLGHFNISVTMRYAHLGVQDLDDYIGVLDYPMDGRGNFRKIGKRATSGIRSPRRARHTPVPSPTGADRLR